MIHIAPEMENILKQIPENPVIGRLLQGAEELEEPPLNYLGFSINDSTKVSYINRLRIERLPKVVNPYEAHNLRQRSSFGRVLTKLFAESYTEKQLYEAAEEFNDKVKQITSDPSEVGVYRGDEIKKRYSLWVSGGTIGSSCMNGRADYMNIYSENPDVISMAAITNLAGQTMARCLLWTDTIGGLWHDRVYYSDQQTKATLCRWLFDNGYANIYDTSTAISVQLQECDGGWDFPYMDSLQYLTPSNNMLHTSHPIDQGGVFILDQTDGDYS